MSASRLQLNDNTVQRNSNFISTVLCAHNGACVCRSEGPSSGLYDIEIYSEVNRFYYISYRRCDVSPFAVIILQFLITVLKFTTKKCKSVNVNVEISHLEYGLQ
jgi:hypothetical protein